MARIFEDVSRTFNEFLLIPNLTDERCIPSNVSLKTPIVKFRKGEEPKYYANVPMVSAIMQSVSGEEMGIALAREGGVAFIYGSQSIESQAKMVYHVKKHKAGFVISDSNVKPTATLREVIQLVKETGHSTVMITEDGTESGKFLGLVTDKDYRLSRVNLDDTIDKYMTPKENVVSVKEGITLVEANDLIWEKKKECLPILTEEGNLKYLVFRKDYEERKNNPNSLLDENKRYIVGAGINTRDYEERIPALVEAGVDMICMDSSDGYSVWQKKTIDFVRAKYGDSVKIGAGNVVDREGFMYLAEAAEHVSCCFRVCLQRLEVVVVIERVVEVARLTMLAVLTTAVATLTTLTARTTLTALATRTALTLYISLRLLEKHAVRELVLASLRVDLHELHLDFVAFLDASLFNCLKTLPVDLRDVEQSVLARHDLYEAAIRHD